MSVEQFVRCRVALVTPFNQSLARLQSYNPILLLSSPLAPPAIPRACFATVTSDSSTTDHKKCRFEQKRPFFQWCAKMQRPFSQLLCCHSLTYSVRLNRQVGNIIHSKVLNVSMASKTFYHEIIANYTEQKNISKIFRHRRRSD